MSPEWASFTNNTLSIGGTVGGSAIIQAGKVASFPNFRLPSSLNNTRPLVNRATSFAGSKRAPLNYAPYQKIRNEPTIISGRRYAGHALDRMQDRGFMPSVIESTIQSNVGIPNKIIGRIQFYDVINNVSVVAENSEVVTVLRGSSVPDKK